MDADIDRPAKAPAITPLDPDALNELTEGERDLVRGMGESLAVLEHARIAINLCRRTSAQLANVEQVDDAVWRAVNAVMARTFNDVLRAWPEEP
jgi:hypothetical protein